MGAFAPVLGLGRYRDGIPCRPKTRQERLGHQNPRTEMKYTHKAVDADVQLVEQLDDLFCPAGNAPDPTQSGKVIVMPNKANAEKFFARIYPSCENGLDVESV